MHNKLSWRNEEIASYSGIPINGYYRDMKNLRLSFILNIYDVWKGTISNIITKFRRISMFLSIILLEIYVMFLWPFSCDLAYLGKEQEFIEFPHFIVWRSVLVQLLYLMVIIGEVHYPLQQIKRD